MINLDLSLSQYHEKPTILPNGLRSYRHVSRFKAPAPIGLFGDLEMIADLDPTIDKKEVARLDQDRKAGAYLKSKLKGKSLSAFHERVLNLLITEDAEYHSKQKTKSVDGEVPKGIDLHHGAWRLRITIRGKRQTFTFPTLDEAKAAKIKYSKVA